MDEKKGITYNACQTDVRTPEARAALEAIIQAAAATMEDWICCPRCKGRGLVLLEEAAPHLAKTLSWLRQHGPAAAGAICRGLGEPTIPTAMANRLVALLELGLVTRKKQGREWIYRAVDFAAGPQSG